MLNTENKMLKTRPNNIAVTSAISVIMRAIAIAGIVSIFIGVFGSPLFLACGFISGCSIFG
ncbi:MAG: hypothetical protein A2286_10515 [Gammaproteobacteria bacterium RIFOXYA12_FULL_61_12]|nr:MAG: hypothetical protein A2286_10515 [Gammaproteobacteria bacterium RIFOXYA12_FULL_61_12]